MASPTSAATNAASSADGGLFSIVRQVGLSEIVAVAVGFLYVSGYFVNSLFVRNLGIFETELLRLEYIKIGFIFTLIAVII